jgi:GNAT superfamily N-acetyltransferase
VLILQFELKDNALTAKAFLSLVESAGWAGATEQQIAKGLEKSLFTVAAIIDERIIGMGRLVGDGFTIWYIQDVVVFPEYQQKGVGSAIMKRLISFAEVNSLPGTRIKIVLLSAKGKEDFYAKLGFRIRPNENEGAGMQMNIQLQ